METSFALRRSGEEPKAMSEKLNLTPTLGIVENREERIELANQLFREFRTRCFWHSPRDLVITEELIPFVVKGLLANGGRFGFMLAGKLQPKDAMP